MPRKQFNEAISLRHREIITVKTVTIEKNYFFLEKVKKQGKGACTKFVLLSQSRNTIGSFMESCFHRPITILQFFKLLKSYNNT